MLYRGCGTCGERWAIGMASTCKCPNEKPKREWVGLTDEEIAEYAWMGKDVVSVIKEVQETLKEKNT